MKKIDQAHVMHKRKKYLIYPPSYNPGDGYYAARSLGEAKKIAYRIGSGSEISVQVNHHPSKFKPWTGSQLKYVGEVV